MKILLSTLALSLAMGSVAMAGTDTSSGSAASGTPAKHMHHSSKHCEQQATAKNLTGDERASFIKECKGKK